MPAGTTPFVAQIVIFPFNFAPKGWAFCDGQLLPISQNTALFSLLGSTYGGDARTTFGLPNLQGAVATNAGQDIFGQIYDLGEQGGSDYITLLTSEMPAHTHTVRADNSHLHDSSISPSGALPVNTSPNLTFSSASNGNVSMNVSMVSVAGGSQPHNNLMPYLTLNYCIALQGVFPARS